MGNLNKVALIGRVGQDPEIKTLDSGSSVMNISLATSETYKDQSGEKQEKTEWHRLVMWNHTANLVHKYCQKGSQIYVEGSLQTREWQDKEGNTRYTTEIKVWNVQLLDSKSSGNQQNKQGSDSYQQNQSSQPSSNFNEDIDDEDDIPF